MRISDWSSDVCSSDLEILGRHKSNFSIASKLDGHLVNHLPLFEQRLRLPCLESPIHESDRFPDTAIITIKHRQDHDKPATILFRSEEHTSELQSLMRLSYAVFRMKKNRH